MNGGMNMKGEPVVHIVFNACHAGNHELCRRARVGQRCACQCHVPAAERGPVDAGPPPASQGRAGRPGRSHECQEDVCWGCGDDGPDIAAVHVYDEQHGFCTLSCMVGYVRGRWLLSPSQLAGVRP